MTSTEYQKLAMTTANHNEYELLSEKMTTGEKSKNIPGIINGCFGLVGETGEFADGVKKYLFHGKPYDEEHLQKELGDVCWYIARICDAFGWDMNDIMKLNIDKLKSRYPEGFSIDKSNNRQTNDI